MLIALWILNGVLALLMLAAGGMKTVRPRSALINSGMAWAEDFSAGAVKLIGIAEVLGAIGLILPVATGIAPVLTPIAAAALTVIMAGAVVVHARRKETLIPALPITVLLLASTVVSALVVL
ncbi:MAG: DoxX family protein [Mycetocola sp.]